jgi:hypothetical protein
MRRVENKKAEVLHQEVVERCKLHLLVLRRPSSRAKAGARYAQMGRGEWVWGFSIVGLSVTKMRRGNRFRVRGGLALGLGLREEVRRLSKGSLVVSYGWTGRRELEEERWDG